MSRRQPKIAPEERNLYSDGPGTDGQLRRSDISFGRFGRPRQTFFYLAPNGADRVLDRRSYKYGAPSGAMIDAPVALIDSHNPIN
jgi:hypothetical protein